MFATNSKKIQYPFLVNHYVFKYIFFDGVLA